ncbi:hypothetical protein [Cyanobacterium sp. uoEpiScrs1]|uniref:hypothetical protein n=1 Tax=Cyanobacterium sp. uoEpiScrs1 TaxID=2976343 RepID=UPI002269F928|nr:hypothetical protein [Cyanobacterium sp. uoEpiScrs1]
MPKITVVFACKSLMNNSLWQTRHLEIYLLNALNYHSLIVTKSTGIRDLIG